MLLGLYLLRHGDQRAEGGTRAGAGGVVQHEDGARHLQPRQHGLHQRHALLRPLRLAQEAVRVDHLDGLAHAAPELQDEVLGLEVVGDLVVPVGDGDGPAASVGREVWAGEAGVGPGDQDRVHAVLQHHPPELLQLALYTDNRY